MINTEEDSVIADTVAWTPDYRKSDERLAGSTPSLGDLIPSKIRFANLLA